MERDKVSASLNAAADLHSLQRHARASQAAIYLHLHLWMHTIIVSVALKLLKEADE